MEVGYKTEPFKGNKVINASCITPKMQRTDNKKDISLGYKSAYSSRESKTGAPMGGAISPMGSVRGHSPYNKEQYGAVSNKRRIVTKVERPVKKKGLKDLIAGGQF